MVTTKNAIAHLRSKHRVGPNGIITPGTESTHQQTIEKERVTDVVQYWCGKSMDPRWRDLAKMALDYLTIPAMSAEPERVFSAAKLTLSDRRCRWGTTLWRLWSA